MTRRRSLLKTVLLGATVAGFASTASATEPRRLLRIQNRDDDEQTVFVRVRGRVRYGPESERDEDDVWNDDGRGTIRSRLDPGADDSFYVYGPIRYVDWTRSEPRLWLDGRRLDAEDYHHDWDHHHDRDWDDHHKDHDWDGWDHHHDDDRHHHDRYRDDDHDDWDHHDDWDDWDHHDDHDDDWDHHHHDWDRDDDDDDDDDDDERDHGKSKGKGHRKSKGKGHRKSKGKGHDRDR